MFRNIRWSKEAYCSPGSLWTWFDDKFIGLFLTTNDFPADWEWLPFISEKEPWKGELQTNDLYLHPETGWLRTGAHKDPEAFHPNLYSNLVCDNCKYPEERQHIYTNPDPGDGFCCPVCVNGWLEVKEIYCKLPRPVAWWETARILPACPSKILQNGRPTNLELIARTAIHQIRYRSRLASSQANSSKRKPASTAAAPFLVRPIL